nr:alpha/beta hydrolase [Sulfitobacter aestuariivivens]
MVCVHGFMGGSDQWALQAPLAEDRELICVDLPGFGRNASLPPISSIQGFAEWVLDALARRGISNFDLMGHSMGGMIVQDMARLDPARIRRLVLYGTGAVGALPGRFEPIDVSMRRARQDGAPATAHRIAAKWFRAGEDAEEYLGCAAIAEQAGLPAILAGLEAMRDWSGKDQLAQISAPTLIIWGDCDQSYAWSQISELWAQIPGCRLAVLPDAGHAAHLEHPALFNMVLSDFLNRTVLDS